MSRLIPLCLVSIFLNACAHAYPVKMHYVTDVTNQVCAEYEIIDKREIKFRLRREMPLVAKGKCDRAFGVAREDVNSLLNWIRKEVSANARAAFVLPEPTVAEDGALDTFDPANHYLY